MTLDAPVSLFHGSTDTRVKETVPLKGMLTRIQDGTYRRAVERLQAIRRTQGEDAYKRAKAESIAFTPGCQLKSREGKTPWPEKLISCTGLVHLDCDGVGDPEALKRTLADNPHVVFAFTSPSGQGVKVGIAATGIDSPESYKHAWGVVVEGFQRAYPAVSVSLDEHVKYLHALCFVSHDPSAYGNPAATVLPIPAAPSKRRVLPTANEYERADYARVTSALAAIPDYDDYDTWLAVGMALHSTGEPWARSSWDSWSQRSDKYNERDQGQTWQSFHADGNVTLGTLFHLAKQHGWQPPPPPRFIMHPRQQPIPDMTQPPTADADAPEAQAGFLAHRLPEHLRNHPDPRVRQHWTRVYRRTNQLKQRLVQEGALL